MAPPVEKWFGFQLKDVIQLLVLVFLLGGTWFDVRSTLNKVSVFEEFVVNSDLYHTEVMGKAFHLGKPVDPNFDLRRIRKIIDEAYNGHGSDAHAAGGS